MAFKAFPKIPRWSREITITEKIDGTNGCIIVENGEILVASRNRILTLEDDNFGFCAWVLENKEEFKNLGDGTYFGEWWGSGINRRYGQTAKKFSLFNTHRFSQTKPECCQVVPIMYQGMLLDGVVEDALENLKANGSICAPGYLNPEGIIIYHSAANKYFKKTLLKDDEPKNLHC